jgi:hypothetical protein
MTCVVSLVNARDKARYDPARDLPCAAKAHTMLPIPADIFTEPADVAPDGLANLGRCTLAANTGHCC